MSDEHPSFLVVILDTKASAWKNQEKLASDLKIRKEDFIKSILIYLNAYILLHRRNRLLVIARNSDSSKIIFPTPTESSNFNPDFLPTPDIVNKRIIESVFEESSACSSDQPGSKQSSIAQTLSKALCGE